jgi:hypothetical protein
MLEQWTRRFDRIPSRAVGRPPAIHASTVATSDKGAKRQEAVAQACDRAEARSREGIVGLLILDVGRHPCPSVARRPGRGAILGVPTARDPRVTVSEHLEHLTLEGFRLLPGDRQLRPGLR